MCLSGPAPEEQCNETDGGDRQSIYNEPLTTPQLLSYNIILVLYIDLTVSSSSYCPRRHYGPQEVLRPTRPLFRLDLSSQDGIC